MSKNASKSELERAVEGFGTIKRVWIARKPAGFGFVTFENTRDAGDEQLGRLFKVGFVWKRVAHKITLGHSILSVWSVVVIVPSKRDL